MVVPPVPEPAPRPPPSVLPEFPIPPTPPQVNSNADHPSDLLNFSRWRLELPTGSDGDIDRVEPEDLDDFSVSPFFLVNSERTGVSFRAHAGGATTDNSGFPRSELREMRTDDDEADWSVDSERTMTIIQRVVRLPQVKPHVVVGQIHDDEDDVVMVRLEGIRMFVESRGTDLGTLTNGYRLGDWFKIRIIVDNGKISVEFNENKVVEMPSELARCDGGCYFKAGCYTQSNETIDDEDEYAEVHISELTVSSN